MAGQPGGRGRWEKGARYSSSEIAIAVPWAGVQQPGVARLQTRTCSSSSTSRPARPLMICRSSLLVLAGSEERETSSHSTITQHPSHQILYT